MLTVDIWSDVVCPFCYMGKRRFENALADFPHREQVHVTWHSFQLDPGVRFAPGVTLHRYLADRKGITLESSRRLHERLVAEAAELGLVYDFDAALIANTFDAHRLTHFARERGRQAGIEERLFAAYFTEGKNIEDHATLALAAAVEGLDADEVRAVLATDRYADNVRADIEQAEGMGAEGAPFYVFNRRYGVAGAQPSELFLEVLQKVWEEPAEEPTSDPSVAGTSAGPG